MCLLHANTAAMYAERGKVKNGVYIFIFTAVLGNWKGGSGASSKKKDSSGLRKRKNWGLAPRIGEQIRCEILLLKSNQWSETLWLNEPVPDARKAEDILDQRRYARQRQLARLLQ